MSDQQASAQPGITRKLLATPAIPPDLMPDKFKSQLAGLALVRTSASPEPTTVEPVAPTLPSLDELPTIAPAGEVNRKISEEIHRKRQWLRKAAPKLLEYEQARDQLGEIERKKAGDAGLSEAFRAQSMAAQEGIKRLTSIDEEMLKRLQFTKLLESIKQCNHMDRVAVENAIQGAVTQKRYRVSSQEEIILTQNASKNVPAYTIFFRGKVYIPEIFPEPAPGQRALEIELTKLVMKARGANRSAKDLLAGKEGLYYLYSQRGPQDTREGHALVKVFDVNEGSTAKPSYAIRITDSIGSVAWMSDSRRGMTKVPLLWVQEGRIISQKRLGTDDFERALRLTKRLRSMLGLLKPQTKIATIDKDN